MSCRQEQLTIDRELVLDGGNELAHRHSKADIPGPIAIDAITRFADREAQSRSRNIPPVKEFNRRESAGRLEQGRSKGLPTRGDGLQPVAAD
jgi:hypothetical protein